MKNPKLIFTHMLLLALLPTYIGGCTCSVQPKNKAPLSTNDLVDIRLALKNVYYLFPSPVEMLAAINIEEIRYNPSLLNSIAQSDKYIKTNDQLLNLGVYLADMSYCALINRNSDAEDYLETIKRISNSVSISAEIVSQSFDRIKIHFNSSDSIKKIADELFYNIVTDLEANNRQYDVAIITAGAYVECLYIATNIIEKYNGNNLIITKIAEQKFAFELLYKYCQKHISNEDLLKYFPYIIKISDAFAQFSELKDPISVINDSAHHILVTGGSVPAVKEPEFNLFKEHISNIRNEITKNNQ